jgi:peptidoglycan biosynthesis protein MviN/MurJ (putative lipid II flippase)
MTISMTKDPIQKQIEYIALGIWIGLCLITLAAVGKDFALGVFLGGALCLLNYQWLYTHARTAVTLPGRKGSSYMTFKYVIRLGVMAVVILALMTFTHVNIVALLVGLSVIVLGIVSYACYTTFFDRGEE